MRRGFRYGAIAVGILVLAAGAVFYNKLSDEPVAAQAAAEQTGAPAMPVESQKVVLDTVNTEIDAVGSLQSNESVVLAPEIEGRVSEILFEEGERVEKGQILIRLDSEILEAELTQAQANLTLSRANYERANTLASQGTGTQRARDEAIAQLHTDEANVALAQARLDKATIRSPFSGVLGLRNISVGAYIGPGDPIVNIEQIDPLKVDFRIPEVHLSSVRAGQRINVTVDALPGETFAGEIYALDPLIDENGRAIRLRARIPNPDGRLSPGLFARVSIIVEQRENAILVPESAVVPQQQDKFVYRIEDGKAFLTKVTIGQRLPGQVEILEGLGPDAVVVTAGQQRLSDGAAVESVEPVAGT